MTPARLFLLAALAAAIGPLLVVGLPETFASSGQDAGTALLWLHDFADAVRHGAWWPRWLQGGNRGFGSPAFLYYPPIAYWTATAVQAATGFDGPDTLVTTALLWRAGAVAAGYAWLRTLATPPAALAATALLTVQTYSMLVNPLVRFALAEMAGTCLLLLALRATASPRWLLWVPPAYAALILTHLPMAVLAGGALPAWALLMGSTPRGRLAGAGRMVLACLIGAGLAGAYLVPALALLPETYTEGWFTGGLTTWSGHFLLDAIGPSKSPVHYALMNGGLLTLLACGAALAWHGRDRAPPLRDRRFVAAAIGLAVLCLLMTRLSWPVWALLPVLQRVQFPWRLMPYATAIWAVLVAVRLDALTAAGVRGGDRIVAGFVLLFAAAALWIPFSAVTARLPSLARYDWTRLQLPLPGPRPLPARNPPEYAPRAAARAGWRADDPATDAALRDSLAGSRASVPELRVTAEPGEGLRVEGRLARPAEVLLPQFAFPGWTLSGVPANAALGADAATGLLRVALPPGDADLRIARAATAPERVGRIVSAASLLLWSGLGLLAAPGGQAVAPRRRPPAGGAVG